MKTKVLIFTTLFLVGNISFAGQTVTQESINYSEKTFQNHTRRALRDELKERLTNRGLDEDYAEELAKNTCNEDELLTTFKMDHYLSMVEGISYDDLMEEIASRALFQKKSNLDDYDTLVGLTQKLKGHHLDDITLEKLSTVAVMNQSLGHL